MNVPADVPKNLRRDWKELYAPEAETTRRQKNVRLQEDILRIQRLRRAKVKLAGERNGWPPLLKPRRRNSRLRPRSDSL